VFGDQRNEDVLRSFLAAALNTPEEQFEEVVVLNPQLEKDYPEDKLGILDVRVLTASGRRIDIEIQLYQQVHMPERITFYTCKNLTSQISSGQSYEDVRQAITIVILDVELLADSNAYHHIFRLYDPYNKIQFTDVIEVHTLELTKLPEVTGRKKPDDRLLDWLRLMKAERLEEYEMLATKSPTLKKTVDILKKLSSDQKTRLIYDAREKARMDEIARMRGSYFQGEQVGIKKGKIEMAQRLLAEDIDPEIIAKTSGLSLEQVQNLAES
jgi:predicted transposase/invertase (TIGR01784 family)